MPTFKATRKAFLASGRLVDVGETFDADHQPGAWAAPVAADSQSEAPGEPDPANKPVAVGKRRGRPPRAEKPVDPSTLV